MNKFLKKIKSQKGISGVVVALMLVLVGIVAVVGIQQFLNAQKNSVQDAANTKLNAVINSN
jgi:Tfp pilus assembly protein PilX